MLINFRKDLYIGLGIMAGTLVISGLILFLISGFTESEVSKIVNLRNSIAERKSLQENLSNSQQIFRKTSPYEAAFVSLLPKKDDLLGFNGYVQNLARIHGVNIDLSFNGDTAEPSGVNPGNVGFSMNISGDLVQEEQFLQDLEIKGTKFLLNLNNIDVILKSSNNYEISVKGKLFYH